MKMAVLLLSISLLFHLSVAKNVIELPIHKKRVLSTDQVMPIDFAP